MMIFKDVQLISENDVGCFILFILWLRKNRWYLDLITSKTFKNTNNAVLHFMLLINIVLYLFGFSIY